MDTSAAHSLYRFPFYNSFKNFHQHQSGQLVSALSNFSYFFFILPPSHHTPHPFLPPPQKYNFSRLFSQGQVMMMMLQLFRSKFSPFISKVKLIQNFRYSYTEKHGSTDVRKRHAASTSIFADIILGNQLSKAAPSDPISILAFYIIIK